MIPKRIIQTGPANIPLILKSAITTVQLLHPTFEYMFFDDRMVESFVQERFPQYHQTFHSFPHKIEKYDFFRYLAVYHYGGFYLDMDVFLARDLTPLLAADCVFPFEEITTFQYLSSRYDMDWQIGNYAFGAAPMHPFLAALIENCARAEEDPALLTPMARFLPRVVRDELHIMNSTGPGLVSRTFAENNHLADRIDILFPDDVRDPRTWHQFGDFGIHHMNASWRSRKSIWTYPVQRVWDQWNAYRVTARSKNTGKTRDPILGSRSAVNVAASSQRCESALPADERF